MDAMGIYTYAPISLAQSFARNRQTEDEERPEPFVGLGDDPVPSRCLTPLQTWSWAATTKTMCESCLHLEPFS